MRTDELDFQLPAELIAQHPAERRDASRLLHFARQAGTIAHRGFADLPGLLRRGDLLVLNDARVTPARFTLVKPTGGRIGGLFLEEPAAGEWVALLKSPGSVRPEQALAFDPPEQDNTSAVVHIIEKLGGGRYRLHVEGPPAGEVLERVGSMPLPPYIRHGRADEGDRERYQTVYAQKQGSVAAPTAGLHFTPELFSRLEEAGVERTAVTLHVGVGTFRPVAAQSLEAHEMHSERYELPAAAAEAINRAKEEGRRVIAVGTTAARVLESRPEGMLWPAMGETRLFIRPGYTWKRVDAMITNFHLPRSTLIALVAAFTGLEAQRRLYREAIVEEYRFYSYGDAMFLEG